MKTAQTTMLDDRGRVTIGKDVEEEYGKEFYVVKVKGEIVLIPKPKDPIKSLQEWGRRAGIKNMTAEKIRREAEAQAYKEIEEGFGPFKKRAK